MLRCRHIDRQAERPKSRTGVEFDVTHISPELAAKVTRAFGFAQGEHWYGVVERVEEIAADEGSKTKTYPGTLTLFSKRDLSTHSVSVDLASQEITLLDPERCIS